MTNPYDTAYADGFIAGDRRAVNSSEDEVARLRAELAEAREIIKSFAAIPPVVLSESTGEWAVHYWCVVGSPGMSHFTRDDLKSARAFLDKAEK